MFNLRLGKEKLLCGACMCTHKYALQLAASISVVCMYSFGADHSVFQYTVCNNNNKKRLLV